MLCTFMKVGIELFKDLYTICPCGKHVKSVRIDKYMTIRKDGCGYLETNLSTPQLKDVKGIKKKFKIHYLMMKTYFLGFDETKHYIIHKNGNTEDNSILNLTYAIIETEPVEEITCDMRNVIVPGCPKLTKLYKVCNGGCHVISCRTGNILSQYTRSDGYKDVRMSEDFSKDVSKNYAVHRLVAYAFIGNENPNLVIDHQDNNRGNNHVSNLRFVTHSENNTNRDKSTYRSKPIQMLDDSGEVVEEFESITSVMSKYPHMHTFQICECLRGDTNNAFGYDWKYKNDEDIPRKYVAQAGEVFTNIDKISLYNKKTSEYEEYTFDNKYAVSNFGTVINVSTNMSIGWTPEGKYNSVLMYDTQKDKKVIMTHNLVAMYYVEKPDNWNQKDYAAVFIDKDKTTLKATNLKWMTHAEHHSEIRGTKIKMTAKDGTSQEFGSIGMAERFLQEKINNTKAYMRSIKSCLSGYQETAYGYKFEKL